MLEGEQVDRRIDTDLRGAGSCGPNHKQSGDKGRAPRRDSAKFEALEEARADHE